MSKYSLGRIEAIIAQLQSADEAGREKYLDHLRSTEPELLAEVLRFMRDTDDSSLEDLGDRIRDAVTPGTALIGRTIRQYKIEEVIGVGGMGVVYKAHDLNSGRDVAVKFLPVQLREDEEARDRFMSEGRAVAKLDDHNVCTIFAVETTEEGTPFLVMALYEGQTLQERLNDGRISNREARVILRQTASGLAAAHAQKLIHRDIKPENLFLKDGETVKILDFGIAAAMDDTLDPEAEGMIGTVAYMSPEQIQIRSEPATSATEKSDLWALGAVGYQMVTGKLPFEGNTRQETIDLIRNGKLKPLPKGTSRSLARVIRKCLRKNPSRRFSSAVDVKKFLIRTDGNDGWLRPIERVALTVAGMIGLLAIVWSMFLNPGPPDRPVLDVVPFVASGGDSVDTSIAFGFLDVLRDDIGRTREVDVRDGYRGYDDLSTYIVDVARDHERDVEYVLGVQIDVENDTVRVNPQLYSDDEPVWTDEEYVISEQDLQSARDRVLRDVLKWLDVELDAASGPFNADETETDVPEAYTHWMRGRGHLTRRTPAALQEAIRQFNEARILDSDFASAYASLSQAIALSQSTGFVIVPDPEKYEQARRYAERAIELDSTNELAHMALGFVLHNFDWNWDEAAREYELALENNPQNADVLHFYSTHLAELGNLGEAKDMQFKATLLSPEVKNYFAGYAMHLYLMGQNQQVLGLAEDWPPDFADFFVYKIWQAFAYMDERHFEEAEEAMSRFEDVARTDHPMALHLRGRWHALQGHTDEALRYADLLKENFPTLVASIYHALGDVQASLEQLELSFQRQGTYMTIIGVWPSLEDLRKEPRYQIVLRDMGLVD